MTDLLNKPLDSAEKRAFVYECIKFMRMYNSYATDELTSEQKFSMLVEILGNADETSDIESVVTNIACTLEENPNLFSEERLKTQLSNQIGNHSDRAMFMSRWYTMVCDNLPNIKDIK